MGFRSLPDFPDVAPQSHTLAGRRAPGAPASTPRADEPRTSPTRRGPGLSVVSGWLHRVLHPGFRTSEPSPASPVDGYSSVLCRRCRKPLHDPVERFIELCDPCEMFMADLKAEFDAGWLDVLCGDES